MAGQGRRRTTASPDPVIEHRRARVASLQLFGWTLQRITAQLAAEELINPVSKSPWSLETIHRDLQAIKAEWKARRQQAVEQHIDMQLAKLERVQEETWKDRQWFAYLSALEQQAKLLGLNAPTKLAPTTPDGQAAWQPEQAPEQFYDDIIAILTEHGGLHPNGAAPAAGARAGLE